MRLKVLSFATLSLMLLCAGLHAQTPKSVTAKLSQATVFFKGAELVHTATATLAKGENELLLDGLSRSIDVQSLKVKTTGNVVVAAYEFSVDYLTPVRESSAVLRKIEDSIAIYRTSLIKIASDVKINGDMAAQLQSGIAKSVSGSEKGLSVDELSKTIEYLRVKSEDIESVRAGLIKRKAQTETNIRRLEAQLAQESTKGAKDGVLKLSLLSPVSAACTFTITYFTSAASWSPHYDINIASTDRPISIAVKAKVQQTTGLDWERVKLTLSSAMPSNGKLAPLFSTWFLEQRRQQIDMRGNVAMQNSYSYGKDEKLSELGFANSLEGKVAGVATGWSVPEKKQQLPAYIIDGEVSTQEYFNSIDQSYIKEMNVLKGEAATSIYGSSAAGEVVVVTTKKSMDDYVTSSDNALNTVYDISIPYTIPGSGKAQNIDLTDKEIMATYKYYCAPKLDPQTYLLSEIADWGKLDLLSGKANVTYDGTFIGETYIDAASTHENMTLTLGTDQRVAVKREKMQDYSSVKFMGSDVLQVFTYKLTVKNNQTKPVKMVLKDQYPTSTRKDIEVILRKETTPWTANIAETGVITWEEELAPGQTKTYQLSYSVKYPKGISLNL